MPEAAKSSAYKIRKQLKSNLTRRGHPLNVEKRAELVRQQEAMTALKEHRSAQCRLCWRACSVLSRAAKVLGCFHERNAAVLGLCPQEPPRVSQALRCLTSIWALRQFLLLRLWSAVAAVPAGYRSQKMMHPTLPGRVWRLIQVRKGHTPQLVSWRNSSSL